MFGMIPRGNICCDLQPNPSSPIFLEYKIKCYSRWSQLFSLICLIIALLLTLKSIVVPAYVFTVLTLLVAICSFFLIRYIFLAVDEERVLLVKPLGLQATTRYISQRTSSVFIPWHCISDIVINEAVSMQQIVTYLAVLVRYENSSCIRKDSIVPLFMKSRPRLAELRGIYRAAQSLLHY